MIIKEISVILKGNIITKADLLDLFVDSVNDEKIVITIINEMVDSKILIETQGIENKFYFLAEDLPKYKLAREAIIEARGGIGLIDIIMEKVGITPANSKPDQVESGNTKTPEEVEAEVEEMETEVEEMEAEMEENTKL